IPTQSAHDHPGLADTLPHAAPPESIPLRPLCLDALQPQGLPLARALGDRAGDGWIDGAEPRALGVVGSLGGGGRRTGRVAGVARMDLAGGPADAPTPNAVRVSGRRQRCSATRLHPSAAGGSLADMATYATRRRRPGW